MNKVFSAIAGIGILIGMYLVLSNYKASTAIISAIASNGVSGIKTLQGR
jgi:multisubunit Na+/H+ antiporter MnhC subunit